MRPYHHSLRVTSAVVSNRAASRLEPRETESRLSGIREQAHRLLSRNLTAQQYYSQLHTICLSNRQGYERLLDWSSLPPQERTQLKSSFRRRLDQLFTELLYTYNYVVEPRYWYQQVTTEYQAHPEDIYERDMPRAQEISFRQAYEAPSVSPAPMVSLKLRPYNPQTDGTTCTVCQEDFISTQAQMIPDISCKHAFHPECLQGWVNQNHCNCPNCRVDL